jgi:hypothetical protein
MATLMGMKVVMMRKWDVEEGKTAPFLILFARTRHMMMLIYSILQQSSKKWFYYTMCI